MSDTKLKIAVLGCTGSIGKQTLDVVRQHSDRFEIVALSAHTKVDELLKDANEFDCHLIGITNEDAAANLNMDELPKGARVATGARSLEVLATCEDADCILVSVEGAAGMMASYDAIKAGKRLALANKESLVVGGDILMPLAKPGQILPVDSEHSAIYQCLMGEDPADIHCIWLTCSGGPFFGRDREFLNDVTPEEALRHPSWTMGPKITIDCATLMNKGLEIIEAKHLFGVSIDDIHVLIHPESKVHSMVEFVDGSTIAELGPSDMRIPIQFALSYPDRIETPTNRIDYTSVGNLTFARPDLNTFRCLDLAIRAGKTGGSAPCVLNASGEIANKAFRDHHIKFTDIDKVVEKSLERFDAHPVSSIDELLEIDHKVREFATDLIRSFC